MYPYLSWPTELKASEERSYCLEVHFSQFSHNGPLSGKRLHATSVGTDTPNSESPIFTTHKA